MKNLYKTIFLLILHSAFLIFAIGIPLDNCFSQQITFQKTFGGTSGDGGLSVQQTTDGGYIIAGHTESFGSGFEIYLIKTDTNGDSLWAKTFGGSGDDYGFSVQQTTDGGYIIAGQTGSFGAGNIDVYLIKTDFNGNLLWTKTFGGTDSDGGNSVRQTSDGGYIIAGHAESFGAAPFSDIYLIKTDANGNSLWTKTLSGESARSVGLTADGGYILAGHSNFGGSYYDSYLIKTDANGNSIWAKTFAGADYDYVSSVLQTADGGYIITGYTESFGAGNYDIYIIKTDVNGDSLWTKTFGGTNNDYGESVQQTTDNGYIITGYTYSFGTASYDAYIIKTDFNGDSLWTKTFGGTNSDFGSSVQQTTDGGFIIAGSTESFGVGNRDVYLIKTDSMGNSGCNEGNTTAIVTSPAIQVTSPAPIVVSPPTIVTTPATMVGSGVTVTALCASIGIPNLKPQTSNFKLFPNPLTTQSKLIFKNTNKEKFLFTLYDITGRITETISTISSEIILTKGSKQPGVYLFNIVNEKTGKRMNGKITISN